MTDDIYKNRERVSNVQQNQKRSTSGRRRRRSNASETRRPFDEHNRSRSQRRSKNRGARRVSHVMKKPQVQKRISIFLTVLLVAYIIFLAVWQFWYQDYRAHKQLDEKRTTAQSSQQ